MKNSGSKQVLVLVFTILVLNTSLSGCEKQKDAPEMVGAETDQAVAQSGMRAQLELLPVEPLSDEERDGLGRRQRSGARDRNA